MNRTFAAAGAAIVIGAAALTGCSSPTPYAPTSYGASGQCYYVDHPAEVIALQRAGLCPVNWGAYPAPTWYRARYADYFDSPAYYDHYVPVSVRKVYVTHVTTWNRANAGTVKAQRVYVGKNASTYSSGNGRGDRAGGSGYSRPTSSSKSRVSVGSSRRSYSSGSRK